MRVGVRELKNRATEIVRQVRENQAEYVITYYGRPVAVLLPIDESWLAGEARRATEAARPGEEVAAELQVPGDVSPGRVLGRSRRSERAADEFVWE
jgi:prevent-host-death family protein